MLAWQATIQVHEEVLTIQEPDITKDFEDFHHGLPILGRDGTLYKVQVNSPAT